MTNHAYQLNADERAGGALRPHRADNTRLHRNPDLGALPDEVEAPRVGNGGVCSFGI